QLLGYRVSDGLLHIGRIDIGRRTFVNAHSALSLNSRMLDDSALDDQSMLAEGETIPQDKRWRGSPAAEADFPLPSLPAIRDEKTYPVMAFGAMQIGWVYLEGLLLSIPALALAIGIILTF